MLPKLFVLVVLITFVSIASASWIVGADSGYLGIINKQPRYGEIVLENALGFLVAGLVEYDFLPYLGARIDVGYASAIQKEGSYYETDYEFKPYLCTSMPIVLPNVEWTAGSGKNKLNIIVAPGLTYSLVDAKSKFQYWDYYSMQLISQTIGYKSNTPDLTGIVGVRCTLFNGISIWTEFKIWGEHFTAAKGTPAPLQVSQDGVVRTFVLGAGYNFF